MLPLGEKMDRREVIYSKKYIDGNPIGRENANQKQISRWYEVEFNYDEVPELTANVIVEQMYAQCDENRNDMLLLDSLIEYRKSEGSMINR